MQWSSEAFNKVDVILTSCIEEVRVMLHIMVMTIVVTGEGPLLEQVEQGSSYLASSALYGCAIK